MTSGLLGTIPQWLTALGIGTFLVALLRRDVQVRGLKNADVADLRDHYAEELQSLRAQILAMGQRHLVREQEIDDRWRKVLQESEDRHDECVRQRNELSERVMEVEQRLLGTVRQFIHFQRRVAEAVAQGANAVEVLASLQPFTEADEGPQGLG